MEQSRCRGRGVLKIAWPFTTGQFLPNDWEGGGIKVVGPYRYTTLYGRLQQGSFYLMTGEGGESKLFNPILHSNGAQQGSFYRITGEGGESKLFNPILHGRS